MKNNLTPYEYYRKYRPEYFSDTKVVYKATLKEEQFQYIMDRLSNDMKQDLFENLTKSLALRFITPNIIPQTGPTGGGDGKTDLETHPVADEIADRWYISDGGCRGAEKWAFAISSKEDWESKVKGDVKKIVDTGRGFTKILFFSNRLIKSKDSKDCEDALTRKYGVPVQIFSQNWYVDKVFRQGCLDLAVKELNLSYEYCENTEEKGPLDKERTERLNEVEDEIITRHGATRFDTELVDLAIEAVILSRCLELPPTQIRGRMKRAQNLAAQYGTKQQLYQAIYQSGWTEFYWLENPDATYDYYLRLKDMFKDEINVVRVERIVTLINLLETADHLKLFKTDINIEPEKEYYESLHRYLKLDSKHQSSYLYMHIHWLEMKMIQNADDNDMLNDLIDDLGKALRDAERHIDIPLESNDDVLNMIGLVVKDNEKFEGLIDDFSEILARRQHEITAAEMQLRRGEQNLEADNNVQAIRHLGQCVTMFGKEQTMTEYVRACGLLGVAYNHQDLLYAGKAMLMRAASMLLHQVEIQGHADHLLITVLHEICRTALRSGQLVDFLNFYTLRGVLANLNPDFQDDRLGHMIAEEQNCLAVRLSVGDVSSPIYATLPDIFNRLELMVPTDVMFYKLGHRDKMSEEFSQLVKDDPDAIKKLRKLVEDNFFLYKTFVAEDTIEIETLVNGCKITASCKNDVVLHTCSEFVLAFIESLCSTMDFKDFVFATGHIHFDVVDIASGKTDIIKGKSSNYYVFNVNTKELDDQKLWEALSFFLALLFTQNAMTNDLMKLFEDKQAKEKLMNRLSSLTSYLSDVKNVIGEQYKANIRDWKEEEDAVYAFQGADDLSEPFEERRGKQATCTIASIIDYPLWDKAKWSGCGFFVDLQSMELPLLLFCYKDITAGILIFEGWAELFKQKQLNIRISIIMHVSKQHPGWYRVQVGQDILSMRDIEMKEGRYVMQATRFHTMQPETTENIDRFRDAFEKCHKCGISAVALSTNLEETLFDKEKRYNRIIPITNIVFREAWEVGVNDVDSPTILPDDDPIIPESHKIDAPVLELLKRKRNNS